MKPSEIADKLERLAAEMSVIVEEADGDLSDEQAAEFDKLEAEMSALKARKERNVKIQASAENLISNYETPLLQLCAQCHPPSRSPKRPQDIDRVCRLHLSNGARIKQIN